MDRQSRAIIVISDLHLGEGRRLWDGRLNLFEDFTSDAKLVEFLNFYSQAYDQVTLVLNGNFFHMMRFSVSRDYPDILYECYAVELIESLMKAHASVVDALRKFMEKAGNDLVYLPGDADQGILWPRVQAKLRQVISPRVRFETESFEQDGIHIQHGHQFDPLYTQSSVEIFENHEGVSRLRLPWGAYFQAHFVEPLRRIRPIFYRVRPMKTYLVWAFLFEARFFFRILGVFLKMIWKALTRNLYQGSSIKDVMVLFRRSSDPESLEERAERLLSSDALQKVILGYSHISDYRQYANGKEYFNSGTWTRTISLDVKSLGPVLKLNYVLIEYRSETPQAKLMEWRGKYEPISDYL